MATALAIPLGLGIGTSERFREYTFPALELFRPIPPVAWVPKRLRYAFDRSAYPAIGTVETPFAIAVVLYLLNSKAVSVSNSTVSNFSGFGLLLVSGGLAANFIREQVASGFALSLGCAPRVCCCAGYRDSRTTCEVRPRRGKPPVTDFPFPLAGTTLIVGPLQARRPISQPPALDRRDQERIENGYAHDCPSFSLTYDEAATTEFWTAVDRVSNGARQLSLATHSLSTSSPFSRNSALHTRHM